MVRFLWILMLDCIGISLLTSGFRMFCSNNDDPVEPVYVEGVDRPECYCLGQGDNKTVFDWTFVHDNGGFDHLATCYGVDNCTTSYPSTVLQAFLEEYDSTLWISNLTSRFSGVITCTQTNATFNGSASHRIRVERVRFPGCSKGMDFPEFDDQTDISCDHAPYAPNTVTMTLINRSGEQVHLGNCSGTKNFKYKCTTSLSPNVSFEAGDTYTNVFIRNSFLTRDFTGATCTVAYRDSTDVADCTFEVYSPAILENCSMEISHHNWSFAVSCDVTKVFSSQGHYLFRVSEAFKILQNGNFIDAGGESFVGLRSVRGYLMSYVNSTDKKEYYKGRVTLSWPMTPYPGTYNSFTVKTYHDSEHKIEFAGGFHVSLPERPRHNCSDVMSPCSCSTETLGSPAGRLLWLIGNTTVAIGDYGVKELLLPSDNLTDEQDVIVATCELDWIQTLTCQQLAILSRADADDDFKLITIVGLAVLGVAAVLVVIWVILLCRGRFRRWSPDSSNEAVLTPAASTGW